MPLCERCNETLKPKASYCGRCGLSTTPEPVRVVAAPENGRVVEGDIRAYPRRGSKTEDKTSVTGWIVALVFIVPVAFVLAASGLAWIGAPGLLIVYGIRWVASKEK